MSLPSLAALPAAPMTGHASADNLSLEALLESITQKMEELVARIEELEKRQAEYEQQRPRRYPEPFVPPRENPLWS